MSEFDGCPNCAKPVMGRTALLAHLEFSHGITDPHEYLVSLEAPPPGRDWKPILRWGGIGAGALAALVGAAVFVAGSGDSPTAVAAAGSESTTTVATVPSTTAAPTTTAPPTTTTPPTTVPPTTAPPTTAPPAKPVKAPSGGAVDADAFRAPFLNDAHVVSCTPGEDTDRYEVGFSLSGARDIVFGGVGYPGDTGNGDQVIVREAPTGSTGYLDHVTVADGGGSEHRIEITPPLYLAGC
jgi:hypothetical protein